MADLSLAAPDTIVEEQPPQPAEMPPPPVDPVADTQPKRKGRQRLFRGLARMSSSPSLAAPAGRARSASTPYIRSGASLSCVSLAPAVSPFAPSASTTATSALAISPRTPPSSGDGYFPSSQSSLSSPPTPFPPFPYTASSGSGSSSSSSSHAIRKVDLAAAAAVPGFGHGSTVPLPAEMARTASLPLYFPRPRKSFGQLWNALPREVKLHVLRFFRPKELVRVSRVNRQFHKLCFDGQLWTSFDASDFYQAIPVESLSKIITAAGPFVKDLNLRGCIQIERYHDALLMPSACCNLVNANLEGSLLNFHNLESLLRRNPKLAHVNLTGLACVNLDSCITLAQSCAQLEVLNLSWCKSVTARGVQVVVRSCPNLRDLRVGEVRGFDDLEVAQTLFRTNRLERLILSGCQDLDDAALCAMVHGTDPEMDILTRRPLVPPRRLRHLDLSRCDRLTDRGVSALGHYVPELEGLVLSGCHPLTDAALEPIFATAPKLAYLDLEDLTELTNNLFSNHLAKAPCAERLTHLSVSYCEDLGDAGLLPALRACKNLRSADLDNTRISDLALAEAAAMVRARAARTRHRTTRPYIGLSLAVYDCPNVTWMGVREVMWRNAEINLPRTPAVRGPTSSSSSAPLADSLEDPSLLAPTFPTEIIALKCFYGWQMTVDEHTKRVLRGDFASAARLDRKWADYMQANEEAGAAGAGSRRRRRRAREAQQVHLNEEEAGAWLAGGNHHLHDAEGGLGGPGVGIGRRRARTATCAIM